MEKEIEQRSDFYSLIPSIDASIPPGVLVGFYALLSQSMTENNFLPAASLLGANMGEREQEFYLRLGEVMIGAVSSMVVREEHYQELAKIMPGFENLGAFCRRQPPSLYDNLVFLQVSVNELNRMKDELQSKPELTGNEREGLSVFESLKMMEEYMLSFFTEAQRQMHEKAYDKAAKIAFEDVLRRAASLHPFMEGGKERATILDFVLDRAGRGEKVRVLDVGTGVGKVCLGMEEALPGEIRDRVGIIASDISSKRFPKGWETKVFADKHPCVQFREAVDAAGIPPEILGEADLIMINGLFDVIDGPADFWHRTIVGCLTNMKPGGVVMIAPCSYPPLSDSGSGIDWGIAMEDISSVEEGTGSPAFAIAQILNKSGQFKAEAYLPRDMFKIGVYGTEPMMIEEAKFLGRFKELAREGKVSPVVRMLLFWLQTNALVVEKLETAQIYPLLPRIFKD